MGFKVALPLFLFTSIRHGGLGATFDGIGAVLILRSALIVSYELTCVDRLVRRLGTRGYWNFAASSRTAAMLVYPLAAKVATAHGATTRSVWAIVVVAGVLEAIGQSEFIPTEVRAISVSFTAARG
jgi:hypothetical protein